MSVKMLWICCIGTTFDLCATNQSNGDWSSAYSVAIQNCCYSLGTLVHCHCQL